jgi:hypothetical protein
MAEVKNIDINEKEKDLKESPLQSDNSGQFAVSHFLLSLQNKKNIGNHLIPDSLPTDTDSEADVLRAAGIDLTHDDNTENVLTLRMWVLAIGFCIIASGLNTLYTLRQPSLTISSNAILLLAYPLGKLWEKIVPAWNVPLGAWSFSLNPGHFSTKVCDQACPPFAEITPSSHEPRFLGTHLDLCHVEPEYLRAPRRRCPRGTGKILWLPRRLGLPDSHDFIYLVDWFLSCWALPIHSRDSQGAHLAWCSRRDSSYDHVA